MAYDGQYINDMDATKPLGTEAKSLGDDAIREIKRILKNSFPNTIDGEAYTGTLAALNNAVAASVPRGIVCPWYGNFTAYPNGPLGWTIADGRNFRTGTVEPTPNLVGRFILGARPSGVSLPAWTPVEKQTLGNTEIDVKVVSTAAYKVYTTDGTSLTTQQMPRHAHFVAWSGSSPDDDFLDSAFETLATEGGSGDAQYHLRSTGAGGGALADVGLASANGGPTGSTTPGSSTAHTHTFTLKADTSNLTLANIPPAYTLVYIVKD